jgi:hypothetical protein
LEYFYEHWRAKCLLEILFHFVGEMENITYEEVNVLDKPKKRLSKAGTGQNTSAQEALHLVSAVTHLTSAITKEDEKQSKDPHLKSFCDTVYYQLQDVEKKKRIKYELAILETIDRLHNE